jgi:hypothetical protein
MLKAQRPNPSLFRRTAIDFPGISSHRLSISHTWFHLQENIWLGIEYTL